MTEDKGKGKKSKAAGGAPATTTDPETARARLAATGRNEPCPCGSGKKYKKCHMLGDETTAAPPVAAPDPQEMLQSGWRLFEQRRPGAAEKEFRAALALAPDLAEARVGIGMSRLSAGDNDGARRELEDVVKSSQKVADDLRKEGAKDAFTRKEAQPLIRASHALGCLAYDQERYEEALVDLERVYAIDEGTVGTEARLIAGKTLMKLARPAEAVPILSVATKSESAASRAQMGLCLAHFESGNQDAARKALGEALAANPHYTKMFAVSRNRPDRLQGAAPGSREEALVYAQTYGDVWKDEAKKFLATASSGARDRGSPSPAASGTADQSP